MGEIVKIPTGDPQKPADYLVVRVQIVHVKKGVLGLRDKVLARSALIPSKRKEAVKVFEAVRKDFEKRGKSFYG